MLVRWTPTHFSRIFAFGWTFLVFFEVIAGDKIDDCCQRYLPLISSGSPIISVHGCFCEAGRAAWFENTVGDGSSWKRHVLADTDQDYHTLAVADFDSDGDVDIFSGDGPLSRDSRICTIWENADGKGGRWNRQDILEGVRCHEAVAGDVDGDGDIDICTKPWSGDLHVFLENLTVSGRAGVSAR